MNKNTCTVCLQGITNPICPECLARQVKHWLREKNPKLNNMIVDSFNYDEFITGTECMFCGKTMNLCAHCYSADIYEMLLEQAPNLTEEYLDLFNFQLREEVT